MSGTKDKSLTNDDLVSHLLGAKKKHDEDKNVETDEVEHLDKGADYLTTMLLEPVSYTHLTLPTICSV